MNTKIIPLSIDNELLKQNGIKVNNIIWKQMDKKCIHPYTSYKLDIINFQNWDLQSECRMYLEQLYDYSKIQYKPNFTESELVNINNLINSELREDIELAKQIILNRLNG